MLTFVLQHFFAVFSEKIEFSLLFIENVENMSIFRFLEVLEGPGGILGGPGGGSWGVLGCHGGPWGGSWVATTTITIIINSITTITNY